MPSLFHQWKTAEPLSQGLPQWVGDLDAQRIAAYTLYEQIYWNVPEAFQLQLRGSDEKPIYIPSAKVIIETAHRYLAPAVSIINDPEVSTATDSEIAVSDLALTNLLRRERFYSKFSAAKRYGLIRGDWLVYVKGDGAKPEGSRLSIFFIDPAMYFPIENPNNVDEIIGCHLVSFEKLGDDEVIRRVTYRKTTEMGGPSPIEVTDELYEVDGWGGPGIEQKSPLKQVTPKMTLPAPIDQLPVYHIRNFEEGGTPWGSSELRGMERLLTALNQGISDEDLSLALEGLGVYVTNAGEPIDENGDAAAWNLGPARVIELPTGMPDAKFERVSGIGTVTPYQDHLKFLERWLNMGSGTPEIAVGRVDVAVAESGVALSLEMAPILSRMEEKDLIVTDVSRNFLWDLKKWIAAYESETISEGVIWTPSYGPKLPENKKQRFDQIMILAAANPPIVSAQWVRAELTKLGYTFPDDTVMMAQILEERTMVGAVEADALGARMDQELANVTATDGGESGVPASTEGSPAASVAG